MYNEFINHYKQVHINPWHEISEDQLNQLFNNLVNSININNDYSFNYLMNYILKRLNGISDAHTRYDDEEKLPINFIIFDNQVIINYPDKLKGSTLLEINGVPINQIIEELDEVITYGTPGRKKYEIEKSLFNKKILFGLPSLRKYNELKYKKLSQDGKKVIKIFKKDEDYSKSELFDYQKYAFGNPGTYQIINNNLDIFNHDSYNEL